MNTLLLSVIGFAYLVGFVWLLIDRFRQGYNARWLTDELTRYLGLMILVTVAIGIRDLISEGPKTLSEYAVMLFTAAAVWVSFFAAPYVLGFIIGQKRRNDGIIRRR